MDNNSVKENILKLRKELDAQSVLSDSPIRRSHHKDHNRDSHRVIKDRTVHSATPCPDPDTLKYQFVLFNIT